MSVSKPIRKHNRARRWANTRKTLSAHGNKPAIDHTASGNQQTLGLCSIASAVLWVVVLLSDPLMAQSSAKTEKNLDAVTEQIEAISRSLNTDKERRLTEQDRLYEAEKSIAANHRSLNAIKRKIEARKKESERAFGKTQELERQVSAVTVQLARLIKDQYMQSSDAYVKQILNQENPYALGRLNNYRAIFSEAMLRRLEERVVLAQELQAEQSRYATQLAQLESDQRSLSSKQAELLSNKSKRLRSIEAIDAKLSDNSLRLTALNNDRTRLQSLLEQIKQAAQKITVLAPRPATTPAVGLAPGGFLKQKKRLSSPVEGKVVTNYGARIPTSGMRSNGIYFESKQNALVRAVYRGTVIFSGYLKGFGELLIIDHGDDHISLYGHNNQLLKKLGDSVEVNESIARVGTTGGLKEPGLYFEIRNNAQPVNPNDWINR